MENYNKTDCLALTIRKEHRLVVINKAVKKTITISVKTILAAICLMFLFNIYSMHRDFGDVPQIPIF